MSRTLADSIVIRPYRDEDESAVLDLLVASLGLGPAGLRPPEFFRWKHVENPAGRSFMLVATDGDRVVGFRSFMRWRLTAGNATFDAARAVDTATHPDYRRMGIFSKLTLDAVELLRSEVDLIFNTPNENSRPGYLKMGWRTIGRMPVHFRIRRPVRFLRQWHTHKEPGSLHRAAPAVTAPHVGEVLADEARVAALLAESRSADGRLQTVRDVDYLAWRYASAPLLGYRAVTLEEGGELKGLGIFRVRPRGELWESTIAEIIVRGQDAASARRLLRRVAAAARVDHLTCHFPPGSAQMRAARSAGFFRSPTGVTFVVNPLRQRVRPDPSDGRSWALSLGDLEVL